MSPTCLRPVKWCLFDRSWYNRAGVEKVMGFCTPEEHQEFLRSCPEFERMLVRSGIILLKYWFSVSDEEQERRFQSRLEEPHKRWKLSPMDLESRSRWVEYSKAKDEMFAHTDIKQAPWYVVNSDIKKHARLNCIAHILSMIPYEDLTPEPIELPHRLDNAGYVRPPITDQTFVRGILSVSLMIRVGCTMLTWLRPTIPPLPRASITSMYLNLLASTGGL